MTTCSTALATSGVVACKIAIVNMNRPSFAPNARATGGTLIEPDSIRTITMTMMTPATAPIDRTSRAHARLPPTGQRTDRRCCGPMLVHLPVRHSPRARGARVAPDHATRPARRGSSRRRASPARAASGRSPRLHCRPRARPRAAGPRAPRLPAWRPSAPQAQRTGCFASRRAGQASSSHSQPGSMTEFLLVVIDRSEAPQLAHDPFDRLAITLPHRVPPFCDELSGAPKVGAFPNARGAALEFPFPRGRMAKIGGYAEPLDHGQLPFDLIRIPGYECPLTGLIGVVQRRSFGLVAVAGDPADGHCKSFLDLAPQLRPRLLGFDLGQQGVEVCECAARLLAGVEI